jgi:hypothetical protein
MNWLNEAIQSIVASYAIITGNADAIDRLDLSERGFWRSFLAVIPIMPLYLYAASAAAEQASNQGGTPLAWYAVSLIVQWIAWPLIVAVIARSFGWTGRYVRYIVAYNWTSVWVMLALLPAVILYTLGIADGALINVIVLGGFALALWMRWFVAKHGLQVSGEIAAALVLADLLLGNAVEHTFVRF